MKSLAHGFELLKVNFEKNCIRVQFSQLTDLVLEMDSISNIPKSKFKIDS